MGDRELWGGIKVTQDLLITESRGLMSKGKTIRGSSPPEAEAHKQGPSRQRGGQGRPRGPAPSPKNGTMIIGATTTTCARLATCKMLVEDLQVTRGRRQRSSNGKNRVQWQEATKGQGCWPRCPP